MKIELQKGMVYGASMTPHLENWQKCIFFFEDDTTRVGYINEFDTSMLIGFVIPFESDNF